jgi:hypothetical protein
MQTYLHKGPFRSFAFVSPPSLLTPNTATGLGTWASLAASITQIKRHDIRAIRAIKAIRLPLWLRLNCSIVLMLK